ncbi:Uncharacterized protein TPAR_07960 [Tolypocladium paradoxum]|uniref:PXA domain-containing protein n=1 Tax=Tolypocladium paradoxum TaxID=94208 RepID=A0A2S4KNS0_9HYPO|nr:Uncharacterized protein TPAR_07960 [Tolypocladium paradoxum]
MASAQCDDAQQPGAPPNRAPRVDAATLNGAPTPEHGQTNPLKSAPKASAGALPPAPPPVPPTLATQALQFFSTATPPTLAGVAVVFSGITYAILGKVGLLIIGALGGVVAFVSLEARNPDIARAVRGEKGPEILDRVWLDLQSAKPQDGDGADDKDDEAAFKAFDDFRPDTRDALCGLVDAVIRDYVKWWYSPIIPTDHSFPLACRKTLNSYLLSVSNRMSRKRPADAFLDLLTNCSSIVIVLMSELAAAFADLPPDSNMTAADAVYNYLASNPDSRLANLLNQRQQAAKFKMVAEDLLGFLDQSSQSCDPARVFLREILANSVLETTLQTCSRAEWINGWIVYLLEAGEPDLNQAIDVGMQTGRDTGNNVFADMDGNVGNIGIAKPSRPSAEVERSRRKESLGHKKKLSKADEKLEEAMEGMKRMNDMIAQSDARRNRDSAAMDSSVRRDQKEVAVSEPDVSKRGGVVVEESPEPGQSFDKPSPRGTSSGEFSAKSEVENTPVTPRSTRGSSSQPSSPQRSSGQQFTSFDQIVPQSQGDGAEDEAPKKAPLTLHNASFTLHDDATGDGSKIRNKPNWDYLIQVEPSSTAYPGWMIVRRYSDFQTLHEILRRIAAISGATAFMELHRELPSWKMHTRESLRGELERYLRDGCWYQSLAESEGMKRFLEKSQGHTHGNSKSFGWETVGKNMLDVLTIAPKGAVEGGKTLVGGVSGVFGNFPGLNRKSTSQSVDLTLTPSSSRLSTAGPPPVASARSPARSERASMDSQQSSVISTQPGKMPPMERRPSCQSQGDGDGENGRVGRSERMEPGSASASALPSREHSRASSLAAIRSPSAVSLDFTKLPPPPDEISDDYEASTNGDEAGPRANEGAAAHHIRRSSTQSTTNSMAAAAPATNGIKKAVARPVKQYSQLSEQETRVAVELLFAVINEMYTLSSAWNIRRTLLTAAKSFLLRPGNPSLLTVQSLIQSSVLDTYASDAGIAASLRKLRENTMPTDQERAAWPAEMTTDEKEKLAVKARRLLIQSGVPAALMGVMGQAATGEALGRVFDCLQIEEVARGLIFGLMLQAVRIVTH